MVINCEKLINATVYKKSTIKGDKGQKQKILYFMTRVRPIRGVQGVNLTGYILYIYGIHSNAVKAIIREIPGKKNKSYIFMTPVGGGGGGSGGKSDQLSRLFAQGFPIPLNTF